MTAKIITKCVLSLPQAVFTRSGNPAHLRILSYCIVLFPSIDVVSAYPLSNHVLVNNLYIFITGHDTTKKPKYKFDWFLRLVLKIVSAILPIAAAFGVANLIYVLKYAGLFGFMCFAFPVLLQLKSIYICKKRFLNSHVGEKAKPLSPASEKVEPLSLEEPGSTDEGGSGDTHKPSRISELKELFFPGTNGGGREAVRAYMTPYSILLFSHPTFVLSVGIVGVFVFILAFLSLFMHPAIVTCRVLLETLLL